MSGQLRLYLLQTPEIFLDDEPVTDFNSNKTRALLIYLALIGQSVTRAALAGLFWGEMTDKRAQANLRKSLVHLRKLVGDHVLIERQTVQFNDDSDYWIDAQQLAALLDSSGETAPIEACEQALQLFQADFLDGFYLRDAPQFEQWMLAQRARLRELAFLALRRVIDYHTRAGDLQRAITHARRLLQLEPWSEDTHAQLMLLYARSGQRSQALNQFRECARMLRNEFGVEPANETANLMRRIRYAPTPADNLPEPHLPLLGRERPLADLRRLLADPAGRLITLTGIGGIGKTRLAVEAAAGARPHFLEGIWFVDLTTIDDVARLPAAIAAAVGFRTDAGKAVEQQLIAYLKPKELLLLLDNYEQLAGDTRLLQRIVRDCPDVKLLVTSRERLRLRNEQVVPLDGLKTGRGAAVQLFVQAALQRQPDFDVERNRQAIGSVCRLVDGVPLAIELAAAAAYYLPCEHIAQAIADNLDFLQTDEADVPLRHQSVRAVYEHSRQQLNTGERTLFAQLAIFRGGFTYDAAAAVCDVNAGDLATLVSKSLVRLGSSDRYECHPLLRQYAHAELVADRPLYVRVAQRHTAHYLKLLASAEAQLDSDDSAQVRARLRIDESNIFSAWQRAVNTGEWHLVNGAFNAMVRFYRLEGDIERCATLLKSLIATLRHVAGEQGLTQTQLALLSRALAAQSTLRVFRGKFDTAIEAAQEAVDIAEEIRDSDALANALINLTGAHFRRSQYDQMQQALDRLDDVLPKITNRLLQARALNWRGVWHARMGHNELALACYQKSAESAHDLPYERAIALLNMGVRHEALGNYEQSQRYLEQSLAIARRIDSWRNLGSALASLSLIDHVFNRRQQAEQRLQEVITLYHSVGNQLRLGQPYSYLGIIHYGAGNYALAERYLQTGLQYFEEQGDRASQAMTLTYLGQTQQRLGDYEPAHDSLQRAQQLAADTRYTTYKLLAMIACAELYIVLGDRQAALEKLTLADKQIGEQQHPVQRSRLAAAWAALHLQQGDLNGARRCADDAVDLLVDQPGVYRIDGLLRRGQVLLAQQHWSQARKVWQQVATLGEEVDHAVAPVEARAALGFVEMQSNNLQRARAHVEAIWPTLDGKNGLLPGLLAPLDAALMCAAVFAASGDGRRQQALAHANQWRQQQAAKITNARWRQTFLSATNANRYWPHETNGKAAAASTTG